MKKVNALLMLLVAAVLFSCKPDKDNKDIDIQPLAELGVIEAHGTIGDGTSMNVLEFINDDGDTVYVTMNTAQVKGGDIVGSEIDIVYNATKDENIGTLAINMSSLLHLWTQKGEDGREQSLELNTKGRAATYGMSVDYDRWEVKDGTLLLYSPKKVGDETAAPVDTFEILELTEEKLVLIHGELMTEFHCAN